jgi:hypothetical protein
MENMGDVCMRLDSIEELLKKLLVALCGKGEEEGAPFEHPEGVLGDIRDQIQSVDNSIGGLYDLLNK